jgi:hypothetical protein
MYISGWVYELCTIEESTLKFKKDNDKACNSTGLSANSQTPKFLLVIRPILTYDCHLTQDLADRFSLNSL